MTLKSGENGEANRQFPGICGIVLRTETENPFGKPDSIDVLGACAQQRPRAVIVQPEAVFGVPGTITNEGNKGVSAIVGHLDPVDLHDGQDF